MEFGNTVLEPGRVMVFQYSFEIIKLVFQR